MKILRDKILATVSYVLSGIMILAILSIPFGFVSAAATLVLDIKETNSWAEGDKTNTQYSLTIENSGDKTAKGWTISIAVPEGASLAKNNFWNGNFKISGTTLTVTPLDYNQDIAAGAEAKDIGFILTTKTTKDKLSLVGSVAVGNEDSEVDDKEETTDPTTEGSKAPSVDVSKAPNGDDWLFTDGSRILDANGTEVWLTGINWFGYNTGTNAFDGIWSVNMKDALGSIADRGFNLLRIPISAELALAWKNGENPVANFNQAENSELVGMTSLEIFDLVIQTCKINGIKVMLDIHSAETNAAGHMTNLWYTEKISTQQFIESLEYLTDRYKNDDTVIAFDLKNEPHGKPNEDGAIWNDSNDENNWKAVAEQAGNAVLDINPNVLIMIEGIEIYPKDISKNGDFSSQNSDDYFFNWWGGNLRGVKDYPVDFGSPERNAKIVYSPHDYGPAVFQQPWFSGDYTYESLQKDCWNENWFFIQKDNVAPLLIGEWGGFLTEPNLTWMTYLRQFIKENHINHTFWCFNANSGDTGGLVKDDFRTWDEEKYDFVKEVLWQENGKFIGLDHVVPLGTAGNGLSLSSYSGKEVVSDTTTDNTDGEGDASDATANETTVNSGDNADSSATSTGTENNASNPSSSQEALETSSGVAPAEDANTFLIGIFVGVGAVVVLIAIAALILRLRVKKGK